MLQRIARAVAGRSAAFEDRADAGRQLAAKLLRYRDKRPVVLALPRGGVPVGLEVAFALNAPLDLVLVRKIGAPYQPELAAAAVAEGDPPVLMRNADVIDVLGLPERYLLQERDRELAEIARRREVYLGARPRAEIEGRTAIVVDDGIATGATVRAALASVRRRHPARLVLATPVGAPSTLATLREYADEIVVLREPENLIAIGFYYRDFGQLTDEDVVLLLARAPAAGGAPPPAETEG